MIDSLIPVGRDCDCGHPMVWRAGHPICAVYGAHREPRAEPVFWRNYEAPFAALVDELTEIFWGKPPLRSSDWQRRGDRPLVAVA